MNIHHLLRVPGQKHFVQRQGRSLILGIALLLGSGAIALAAIAPDVANTRHNLSASNAITAAAGSSFGTTVKATSETQICVFCHTPHAATAGQVAPLWNRELSNQTYTFYSSSSIDAYSASGVPALPPTAAGIGSKLCLSCHDGTLAIGTVGVLNNAPGNIAMQGVIGASGVMPDSTTPNTGFTRKIGIDLSNDHPISFTFDSTVASADGELYTPGASGVAVANRVRGQPVPQFPLINNQLECITCHDPHLKSDQTDPISGEPINNKFLRGNRFQLESPTASTTGQYDATKDIICLACHNKPTWATSTHSNIVATSEIYKDGAADLRDFPRGITTWQAACSNCHDTHTVPGSRRLLREAVDSPGTFSTAKTGGAAALEQVCYQCHSPASDRILVLDSPDQVPDVKTDFSMPYRMPIVTAEQGRVPSGQNTTEVHDIGVQPDGASDCTINGTGTCDKKRGIDFIETRTGMGAGGNLTNRHAECTDCHQPHRVTRTQLFNGDPTIPAITGTHRHAGSTDPGGVPHNNLASGSQRGQFGVEPVYTFNSFHEEPTSFIEKRGSVKTGASDLVTSTWLTREYQVCAKCHSNYAFGPLQGTIANPSNIPALGRNGGTPSGTNGMRFYTNIFREIRAPDGSDGLPSHQGNAVTTDSGAHKGMTPYDGANAYAVDFTIRNRRSWHPVMRATGRTPALRSADKNNWLWPWSEDVGNQTMYCTDCHGSNTAAGTVVPAGGIDGSAWGPHGSTNIFLLKGWWDNCTGAAAIGTNCTDAPGAFFSSISNTEAGAVRPALTPTAPTINEHDLCFKCHNQMVYLQGDPLVDGSGFGQFAGDNLHGRHKGFDGFRCMYCHVAVPHGWKNKAFLVNLNDVGPEADCRQADADDMPAGYKCTVGQRMLPGTQVHVEAGAPLNQPAGLPNGTWAGVLYNNPPYYRSTLLKVAVFAPSGLWAPQNCGAVGAPSIELAGPSTCGGWMAGNEGCSGVP